MNIKNPWDEVERTSNRMIMVLIRQLNRSYAFADLEEICNAIGKLQRDTDSIVKELKYLNEDVCTQAQLKDSLEHNGYGKTSVVGYDCNLSGHIYE